jgi:hypothetical protein
MQHDADITEKIPRMMKNITVAVIAPSGGFFGKIENTDLDDK